MKDVVLHYMESLLRVLYFQYIRIGVRIICRMFLQYFSRSRGGVVVLIIHFVLLGFDIKGGFTYLSII